MVELANEAGSQDPGRDLNAPQAVNLALGTAAFVKLADISADVFGRFDAQDTELWIEIFLATLTALWAIKVFIDDHKSFGRKEDGGLPAMASMIFSTAAYLTLIMVISALPDIQLAANLFGLYFGILAVWTLISFVARYQDLSWSGGLVGDELRKHNEATLRLFWLLMNLTHAIFYLLIFDISNADWLIYLMCVPGVFYVIDAYYSGSFVFKKVSS